MPKNKAQWSTFKLYDQYDISKILLSLKPNSHYNDPLPSKCWPACNLLVTALWTKIINESLTQGSIPDCLKTGQVTPLIKKPTENPSDANNFRPVTTIPLLAKALGKCVHNQLNQHMTEFKLLNDHQSGFRPNHSTETAILHIVDDVLLALDRNETCLLILLDLSSAFDTVNHHKLLDRLEKRMGLADTVLKWFHSFLENRNKDSWWKTNYRLLLQSKLGFHKDQHYPHHYLTYTSNH